MDDILAANDDGKITHVSSTHYGTKPGHFETLRIQVPTSEGVGEVSERAVRSKRTSERCEQTSERTSEVPSTSVCILGCFRP